VRVAPIEVDGGRRRRCCLRNAREGGVGFVERSCGCKIFYALKKYNGKQGDVLWLTKFSKRSQTLENAENVLC
jgi:hypothetical protein